MVRDPAAAAEAIVDSASALCETEDNLWDVIKHITISPEFIEDNRDQSQVKYQTDELARAFLYQHARGLSQKELATKLEQRTSLLKAFGFEFFGPDEKPRQQSLNHAWNSFSEASQRVLKYAGEGIAAEAVDKGILSEVLAVVPPDDEEDDDVGKPDKDEKRRQVTKVIRLARKYAIPYFDTKRAPHKTYTDGEIWDMLARICHNRGSAHSEHEYGWLTDDDLTCVPNTFLNSLRNTATPPDIDQQLSLDEFESDDLDMQFRKIQMYKDEVLESFNEANKRIIETLKGEDVEKLFSGERKTTVAIDTSMDDYWATPWEDGRNKIPRDDFPMMVRGYKDTSESANRKYKRGYEYMTLTLVGDHPPILLAIEPVKSRSKWEDEDAPRESKAEVADRLLSQAKELVDIDEVLLDRAFKDEVHAVIHDHELRYLGPKPKYKDDLENIADTDQEPGVDAAVQHNVTVEIDGEDHHKQDVLYVPSTSDDADGKYAVFVMNRFVDPDDAIGVVNTYSRRWDIENQYKSMKDFWPKTSSPDFRIRFCRIVFAALIYNLWRLADYILKIKFGLPIRSPPLIGAKTFVRALGDFLREFD